MSRHATPEVIKAAYRALARASHPDVNNGKDTAQRMRELNAAYEELKDPVRRATIDARIRTVRRAGALPARARERTHAGAPPPPTSRINQPSLHRRGYLTATLVVAVTLLLALLVAFWAVSDVLGDSFGPLSIEPSPVLETTTDAMRLAQHFSTRDQKSVPMAGAGEPGPLLIRLAESTKP